MEHHRLGPRAPRPGIRHVADRQVDEAFISFELAVIRAEQQVADALSAIDADDADLTAAERALRDTTAADALEQVLVERGLSDAPALQSRHQACSLPRTRTIVSWRSAPASTTPWPLPRRWAAAGTGRTPITPPRGPQTPMPLRTPQGQSHEPGGPPADAPRSARRSATRCPPDCCCPCCPCWPRCPCLSAKAASARLAIAAIVILVGGALWYTYWYFAVRGHAYTDDAYIGGDVVQVTSQLAGTVVAIGAGDTATVKAGDLLVRLDDADAKLAVAEATSSLATAVRQARQQQVELLRSRAQAQNSAVALARAESDLARRQGIEPAGAVSGEELAHARQMVAAAQAQTQVDAAAVASAETALGDPDLHAHPLVASAAARLSQALLDLERCTIRAPVGGQVAKRSVELGARIQPGEPLLSLIDIGALWVDANFKERQLDGVAIGQAATVHADIYGRAVDFRARVVGLDAGTGNAFALLPAQNASGNWIKIVQRLPVRVSLDPRDLASHPLRIGLSAEVSIDLGASAQQADAAWTGGSTVETTAQMPSPRCRHFRAGAEGHR